MEIDYAAIGQKRVEELYPHGLPPIPSTHELAEPLPRNPKRGELILRQDGEAIKAEWNFEYSFYFILKEKRVPVGVIDVFLAPVPWHSILPGELYTQQRYVDAFRKDPTYKVPVVKAEYPDSSNTLVIPVAQRPIYEELY